VRTFAVPAVAALATVLGAWSCLANEGSECPGCPPPIGTPHDAGIVDVPALPDISGPCPGQGTAKVAFDRGEATVTCWSATSPLTVQGAKVPAGEPTVTITGNPTSSPGLTVAIFLYTGINQEAACGIGPGSKLDLGGPCVFVAVAYGATGNSPEWKAFGGAAVGNPVEGGASTAGARGEVLVESYGTTLGASVSVSFSPGSLLVLDVPTHPVVSISGSATAPLE
jgi:hypothetical protein